VAILLTSAVWIGLMSNQNNPFGPTQGNNNPETNPTPTVRYTPSPTQAPTVTSTPTLATTTGTTTPTIPEFTLKYFDHSYDVPPTYKIEPYTGKTVVDHAGYHVDNRTIDVTIKNQAFTPSITADGNTTALYYNVRSKGHYEAWNIHPTIIP